MDEDTALEETALEETAPEEAALEETALEETALEETALEETAPEEAALEETSPKETAPEETALEETALEETALEETALEEEEDDSSWGADEDPWWCFDVFWCGPLEHLPLPPDFVPPLRLASLRVPDEAAGLTAMYAIPMPTPVAAFGGGGGAGVCGKPRESSRRSSHSFTDTSDALAGGRGAEREARQFLRKLRVQQLLLETHERRSRRMLTQEETAAWKAVAEERPLVFARHGRR
ncbi:uncharacterized protein Tco025E_01467 [Trypanosoma conorhini]|uniref:Uncharacterized protein n=1 Tax=Trypanosoma conorhini TaxID=83891 RepID=A0A3R7LK59_9TRYP|nr:uncharacterized protein Tco025E_01467 [Trypanosoma conorhini]RNF26251.1 hypothetical protein Tco025E_01467 [Trypanosoma conorhini]